MKKIHLMLAGLALFFAAPAAYCDSVKLVKDFTAGSTSSNPIIIAGNSQFALIGVTQPDWSLDIYSSDATSANTVYLTNVDGVAGLWSHNISGAVQFNNLIVFSDDPGSSPYTIWVTDGTTTGTVLLTSTGPSGNSALYSNPNNPYFYLFKDTTGFGREM